MIIMSDLIQKIKIQAEKLECIHIVVDSETYEKTLPEAWFYATMKAGVNVVVSDSYLPKSRDHFGMILYEEDAIYWIKIW